MSKNTKNQNSGSDFFAEIAEKAGMIVMTAAAISGFFELPSHSLIRVALPGQASLSFANLDDELNTPVRREKEEAGPHYVSYSVSQRTHSTGAAK
jgi:hypothetical protein